MTIFHQDCLIGMKNLKDESFQIIIADPPYNIGKDFGNNSDCQTMPAYIEWCKLWILECMRLLKNDGTFYIYGFPEILAQIQVHCIKDQTKVRWLVWHYTNKTTPSSKFWQRSHESIIIVWKNKPHFNLDAVREPYTDNFLNNCAGKTRKSTIGRFSDGTTETIYNANNMGAMPRDVIKIPALAGGAGKKEKVAHPTQKPLDLCKKLLLASHKKNEKLLVPFAGSGSECVAASELDIEWVAFEINPEYIKLIEDRFE